MVFNDPSLPMIFVYQQQTLFDDAKRSVKYADLLSHHARRFQAELP